MTPPLSLFSADRFRRALRWFVAGRAVQAAATIGITLLAMRLLPLSEYGTYMVIWGIVELAMPLTSLGLLPAVQRFLPEFATRGHPDAMHRFVRATATARIALIAGFCALLVLLWPLCASWFGLPTARDHVPWIASGVVLLVLTNRFVAEMLECLLEQRYAQVARAMVPSGRLAGLLLLWAMDGVSMAGLLMADLLAAAVAAGTAQFWLARRLSRVRPTGETEVVSRADLLHFIWHMSAAQLLSALSSVGTLRLIVARTLGVEVAGVFSFLQQLMMIGGRYLPSTLLANMVRPLLISRLSGPRNDDVATGLGLLWKLNVATAWPLVAMAAVVGSDVVQLLSSARIQDAGWAFVLLLLALVAVAQTQVVQMALQVVRRTDLVRNLSALSILAPLLVWALSPLGLLGVCAGIAVDAALRSLAGTWALQRLPERAALDWRGAIRVLAALAAATTVAYAVFAVAPARWPLALVAFLCAYVGCAFIVRPLAGAEVALLVRALGRRASWMRRLAARAETRS